jgi:hypothetical protein
LNSKKYPPSQEEARLLGAFQASLRVLVFLVAAAVAGWPPMLLGPNLAQRDIPTVLALGFQGLEIFFVIYVFGWAVAAAAAFAARGTKVIAMFSRFPLGLCLFGGCVFGFCYGYLTFLHDGPPAL